MSNMARFRKALLKTWEALPPFFMTSAEKIANAKKRIEELERLINCWDKSEQKKSHIVGFSLKIDNKVA